MKIFRSTSHFFKTANNKIFTQNSDRHHFSSEKHRSILDGKLNYNQAFPTFVRATHQKKHTAEIFSHFINNLKKKGVIIKDLLLDQPLNILDLGSANSNPAIGYINGIHSKFNYWGVDNNSTFLEEAKKNLSESPKIAQYKLINADALSGQLRWKKEFEFLSFDIILFSHIAYYIQDELACKAFLMDIIKLLSPERGIAIGFHEDSTFHFRSTYNEEKFKPPTTPLMLENSARKLAKNFNQFQSIDFTSKLHFSPLSDQIWEMMKSPELYWNCAYIPNFIDTLEKLAFIVQCDLSTLAKKGTLSRYVDEVKDAIMANDNCLDLKTQMLTLVAHQCKLQNKIAKALTETEKEIPNIINKIADEEINKVTKREVPDMIIQDPEQCSMPSCRF